jgi:hypothetical protein
MRLKRTHSSITSVRTTLLGVAFCLSVPVQWAFLLPNHYNNAKDRNNCHVLHPCRGGRVQRPFSLSSAGSSDSTTSSSSATTNSIIINTIKSSDRFDRWKFLQDLLDDSLEKDEDAEQVLFAVLQGYPLEGDGNGIPVATPEQKETVQNLLLEATGMIPAFSDLETLRQVEALLPDPLEDQDGFKSAWDTVLELHGREMVQVNEEAATERWKALSIVGRVLIHYEFLTEGIQGA